MLRRKIRMRVLRLHMIGHMCSSFREDGQGRPHCDTIWEKLPEEEEKKLCREQMTEHSRWKAWMVKMLRLEHVCSDEWTSEITVQLSEEKERGSEVREKTKVQTMLGLPATLWQKSPHLKKTLAKWSNYCITEAWQGKCRLGETSQEEYTVSLYIYCNTIAEKGKKISKLIITLLQT